MKITVNGKDAQVETPLSLGTVRDRFRPGADVLILNGFPSAASAAIGEGDEIHLIRRGEVPAREEMEALLVARHSPGVHRMLRAGRVGIAGLGGLGSAVALALARCGVGAFVLADFDVVEPSNLNRQQYFVEQLGREKTAALAENLRRANPYVELELHRLRLDADDAVRIFAGAKVIVEAFDDAGSKAMLISAVLSKLPGTPVVAASGVAGFGPANRIVTASPAKDLYVVGDGTSEARPGVGLMAPRVGVAAHHQANAVVRILLGEDPLGAEDRNLKFQGE